MNTPDMLIALKESAIKVEATTLLENGQPIRAWVCYRGEDGQCHIQIAEKIMQGLAETYVPIPVPMLETWEIQVV